MASPLGHWLLRRPARPAICFIMLVLTGTRVLPPAKHAAAAEAGQQRLPRGHWRKGKRCHSMTITVNMQCNAEQHSPKRLTLPASPSRLATE